MVKKLVLATHMYNTVTLVFADAITANKFLKGEFVAFCGNKEYTVAVKPEGEHPDFKDLKPYDFFMR